MATAARSKLASRMGARIRTLLTYIFVATALFFIASAIVRRSAQVRSFEWDIEPLWLLLSIALLIAVLAGSVLIWGYVLDQLDYPLGFMSLARVWFLSNLARYIPGKVWQFVAIVELGRSLGVPAVVGVTSTVVFMGYVLIASWFVGIYLLPAEALGPLARLMPIARLTTPLLLLLLTPRVMQRAVALGMRLAKRESVPWKGGWPASILLFGSSVLLWIGFGVAFYVFIHSLTGLSANQFPAVTAVFALAFFASYIVVIAPAGLGAKEGMIAALLSSTLPFSVAAAVAVASRLWTIVAEVVPALAFAFIRRRQDTA